MKTPKAPNPYTTAAAQAGSNQSTAISQQLLNQTNQVTPYGNLTYSQTGTNTYFDPALNKEVSLPSYTATQTFTPEQQALFEQQQAFDKKFNDIALGQADKVGTLLQDPFQYGVGEHEAWAGNLYDQLTGDTNAKNMASYEQRLANQGLQAGSAAYDDAMRNLMYSQDKARNDFMLNSYNQGFDAAQATRNQMINETNALAGGQQVQQPTFQNTPQVGVNGVDIAGLVNQDYQNKLAAYQSQMGGLFGLGSAALGGLFALSDRRAKKHIKPLGDIDGVNVYEYEYKKGFGGDGEKHIGVMAQEVESQVPGSVMTGADGYKRVDYGRIVEALA